MGSIVGLKRQRVAIAAIFSFCLLAGIFLIISDSFSQAQMSKGEIISSVGMDYTWGKKWYSRRVTGDFTIRNNAPYTLKNFEVTCDFQTNSGLSFGTSTRVMFEVLNPRGEFHIKGWTIGWLPYQATRVTCKVTNVDVPEAVLLTAGASPEAYGPGK